MSELLAAFQSYPGRKLKPRGFGFAALVFCAAESVALWCVGVPAGRLLGFVVAYPDPLRSFPRSYLRS